MRGHLRRDDHQRLRHVADVDGFRAVDQDRGAAAVDRAVGPHAVAFGTFIDRDRKVAEHRSGLVEAAGRSDRAGQDSEQFGGIAAFERQSVNILGGENVGVCAVLDGNHLFRSGDRYGQSFSAHRQREGGNRLGVAGVQHDAGDDRSRATTEHGCEPQDSDGGEGEGRG